MPREIVLLTNPAAGTGAATRAAAVAAPRLRDAGFRVRVATTGSAEDAGAVARDAAEAEAHAVVVVGGDGLVHVAVQALAHTGTALGIIPAGAGNDAARVLGVPRGDPRRAADVVVGGATRVVDLGRAGPTRFLCVLSAGFDALVTERANGMRGARGRLRYPLATLAGLRDFRPLRYTLEIDGDAQEVEAMLVAVGNGPSYGGGLRIAEGARLDDGLLDVVLFHPVSRADLLRTFPRLYRGTHTRHPAYEHHRVREVTLAAPGVVAYADGERLGPLPVTVAADPAALRVLVADGAAAGRADR